MKNKKISVLFALAIVCVLSLSLASQTVAMASMDKKQSKFHNVGAVGKYNLLAATADDESYDAGNYVARYVTSGAIQPSFSSVGSEEVKLTTSGATQVACYYNANLFVYADFADNIATAIKNGAISMQTTVWLKSGSERKNDAIDETFAEMYYGVRGDFSYSADGSKNQCATDNGFRQAVNKTSSENQGTKTDSYLQYTIAASADELAGKDITSVALHSFTHFTVPSGFIPSMTAQNNTLYMKSPVLTLTTNDNAAPSLGNVRVTDNVDGSKIVTVTVVDSGSGVQNVTIGGATDGGLKSRTDDTRTAVYEYVVAATDSISVTMTDNVGNAATTDVALGKLTVDKLFTDKNIAFTADLPDGNYYFTTDGTEPNASSAVAANGANNTTVVGKGDYTLWLRVVDEKLSYTVDYVQDFCMDDTEYPINVAATGCIVDAPATARYGTEVTLDVTPNSGYELYKVLVDGVEVTPSKSVAIVVTADTAVKIVCRRRITELVPAETYFVYDGNPVALDFGEVDVQGVTFSYGEGVTELVAAGNYIVSWNVDNDNAVGSGSFEIVISPLVITVSDVVTRYVYKQFDFTYVLSQQMDCVSVRYTNSIGLAPVGGTPKLPGTYGFEFVSSDPGVELEGQTSGELVIEKIKISFDVNTSIFKEFEDVRRQLEVRLREKIEEIADKFNVSLFCNDNEVADVYNAGVYRYSIELTDDAEELYEVVQPEGNFVVEPRKIAIRPLKNQYRYVGEESGAIAFELAEALPDGISVVGNLTYDGGDNAGEYLIKRGDIAVACGSDETVSQNYELVLDDSEQVYYTVLSRKIVVKTSAPGSVYGEGDSELLASLVYGQLADGDSLVALRQEGNNAGKYAIDRVEVVNANGEDVTDNYSIVVIAGDYDIAKRALTVVPTGFTKIYGEADGEITYTASGLIDGDALVGSLVREAGENVGLYRILQGSLANDNYEVTVAEANCVITVKNVVVTAENITKIYGETDPEIVANCADADVAELGLHFMREVGENVGEYRIYLERATNADYNVTFDGATLTVKQAEVLVEVEDLQKVYGEADPEFRYVADGADKDELQLMFAREAGENAGEYAITATCNANYKAVVNKATLTIVKADKAICAEAQTAVYNGKEQRYTAQDDVEVIYRDGAGNEVAAPVDAGEYEVELVYVGDENHNANTVRTTLTVKAKMISVVVDVTPVKYEGQNIMPVFTLSEEVNAMVVFDGGSAPTGAGEYGYTIVFESQNYYCNVHATLIVVA